MQLLNLFIKGRHLFHLFYLPAGWNAEVKAGAHAATLDHEAVCERWQSSKKKGDWAPATCDSSIPALKHLPLDILHMRRKETNFSLV